MGQTASAPRLFCWGRALSSVTPAIPAQNPNETSGSNPEADGFWTSPRGWLTIFILLAGALCLLLAYMLKRRETPRINNFNDVVSAALGETKTCDKPKVSPEIATKVGKIVSRQDAGLHSPGRMKIAFRVTSN